MATTKAVILARGLGTRMRRTDPGAVMDRAQSDAADAGLKGMIPIRRPFLDYIISGLADAGFLDVCIVIGPEHDTIRTYYDGLTLSRVRLHFAVQAEPRGTADAVLAAEAFAAGDTVVALNSDNYYPVQTLRALRELDGGGVAAFEREALVRNSNITADRVAAYAIVTSTDDGYLARIVEKPGADAVAAASGEVYVSMNSWSLPPSIYEACRAIPLSSRGELELPAAVQYAIDALHVPFRVVNCHDGVLDLSQRSDIPAVARALDGIVPEL